MRSPKKHFYIILVITISALSYFAYTFVLASIEERDFEKKKVLLHNHLANIWWTYNNLEIDQQRVWSRPNNSFPGFVELYKYTFLIHNKSSIDISSITLQFELYGPNGKPYLHKKVEFKIFLKSNSIKPIERYLVDKEFEAIPEGFRWAVSLENAEPYPDYVASKSLEEINQFILSDSLSLKGPDVDWEKFEESVDSLGRENY